MLRRRGRTGGDSRAPVGPYVAPPRQDAVVARFWRARERHLRRIRPTREGWIFAATGLAVAVAALNTGNNLLYLLLALLLGVLTLSGVLSEMAIRALVVERELPPRIVEGAPAAGQLVVRNPRRWVPHLALHLQESRSPWAECSSGPQVYLPVVLPNQAVRVAASWTFGRRGTHRLRAIRIATRWPFGLLEKWYECPAEIDVLVLPAALPGRSTSLDGRDRAGGVATAARGDGDLRDLRDLGLGEDPRHAHPRISARRGRPTAVERDDDRAGAVEVLVAEPKGADAYDRRLQLDHAVRHAAGAVLDAERARRPLVLRTPGRTLRSAGPNHGSALAALALVDLVDGGA